MNNIQSPLVEMGDQMRALHEALGECAAIVDLRGERFRWANPVMCQKLGYSETEILTIGLRDIHPPERLSEARTIFIEMTEGQRNTACDVPLLRKDGGLIYANVRTARVQYQDAPCLLGLFHDVTEERNVVTALRESEATLRGLFENLPDLVLLVDEDFIVQSANRDLQNVRRADLVGSSSLRLVAPQHRPLCREAFQQALSTGARHTVTVQDIFGTWWSCRAAPLGQRGDRARIMLICVDVTQDRVAAEAVKKEQRLLRQMLELQERERRMIASEIHEGLAQQLTGALFRLQAFRETLSRNSTQAWTDFDMAARTLARSIDEARRLISSLRPPILDELGIVDAIEYVICERRLQGDAQIEFDHDLGRARLSPPLENGLFRIVLESLNNACRHSRSERIYVRLCESQGWIHLQVRDWGVGFDANEIQEKRFGLQGVRERVRLLDGKITIESAPNRGTHITVELPLASDDGWLPESTSPVTQGDP
ncbi:MAG: PAS domain S-box protein [Thermoguttaceae bacterium]